MAEAARVGHMQCPACSHRQPLRVLFFKSGRSIHSCDNCGSKLRLDRDSRMTSLGLIPYFSLVLWVEDHYPLAVVIGTALVLLVPLALWDAWSSRFAVIDGDRDD